MTLFPCVKISEALDSPILHNSCFILQLQCSSAFKKLVAAVVEAFREGCGKFGEDVGRHGRHFLSGLLVFGSQGLESFMEYASCIGCHVEAFKLTLCFGLGSKKS